MTLSLDGVGTPALHAGQEAEGKNQLTAWMQGECLSPGISHAEA